MAVARVRMFAGPNGSGKSMLIGRLQDSNLSLGPIVNADQLLAKIENSGFIDLKDFEISGIDLHDWQVALDEIDELSSRIKKAGKVPSVTIREDMLVCDGDLYPYYSPRYLYMTKAKLKIMRKSSRTAVGTMRK
mgnify:CR=1 FL=1